MSEAAVVVDHLSKRFQDASRGEVRAVDGISFHCGAGEIFGLLGANGAGKTTTLRMLATLLQPTSGTARLAGYDVVDDAEQVREHLGFYTATTALYPRLTARETLRFFATINRYPRHQVEDRVEALIARFAIADYADARIDQLSSGMKQKVQIARTVAHDPPILIFDEPTVGLDVINAQETRRLVEELRAEGKAILFSTHIMSEAEKVCDRIGILHAGKILAIDTLEGLRQVTGLHYLEDIFLRYVARHDDQPPDLAEEQPLPDGPDAPI